MLDLFKSKLGQSMLEPVGKCIHCNRPLVKSNSWLVHRLEDFDPTKPIDCFQPEMKAVGDTSDGFHTFNELYDFRMALTANLFNEWAAETYGWTNPQVWKSRRHHDGQYPFGDPNWFLVVAETEFGQISFHYDMRHWDLFRIANHYRSPKPFDGHTSADSLERLIKFARSVR